MASITLPTNELNQIIRGDVDILNAYSSNNGTGTMHIRSGGLYVEGLSDLDQTTINTTDGKFHVLGTNKVEFNVSGGATSSIEMTAEDASFWTTTAGTLALSATATNSNGKITITADGTGTNSIYLNATNTTSGQITLDCASADTASDAIRIRATDTVDGNILIQGSGSFASSNPAIKLYTDNATSGQILLESAGDAAGSDGIKLNATGTTGGNVSIVAAGSTDPAVLLDATSSTSGKVLVRSAGDSTTVNSVELLASATTNGNVLIQGNGTNTNKPAIKLFADNNTSGQIVLEADGNIANAIRITADNATAGGIDIDATGLIAIDTTSTGSGITIATATAGVPVVIGTATSLTTIVGDLLVSGTTTTINTETMTVEDNIILLNSGNGEIGLDAGLVVRRFQTPNGAGTGDVVTSPNPIQESGAFVAGSSTPATLVIAAHASDTDDFYNGWWVKITSGAGANQVRRVKDYVGSTKTITLYVTADNSASFIDGLDLVTAPAATDTYELYSDSHVTSHYDESEDAYAFATVANIPDAISAAGTSTVAIQQYQSIHSGELDVHSQVYNNVLASASGTVITLTLRGHGLSINDLVGITNSTDLTPNLTSGTFVVQTTPTANTFTITAAASTTSVAASSVTVTEFQSSRIRVNTIEVHDAGYGSITIPGVTCYEDIVIPKTSTAYFFITSCTNTYGAYLILIGDLNNTDGSFGAFIAARSTSTNNGTLTRLATAKGTDGQRIDADWLDTEKVKIRHTPAGVGAGNYTYRVRVYSVL